MHWGHLYEGVIRLTVLFDHACTELPYFLCSFGFCLACILSISCIYSGPYFLSHILVRHDYAILLKQSNSPISGWGGGDWHIKGLLFLLIWTRMWLGNTRCSVWSHGGPGSLGFLLLTGRWWSQPSQHVVQWKATSDFNCCYSGMTPIIFPIGHSSELVTRAWTNCKKVWKTQGSLWIFVVFVTVTTPTVVILQPELWILILC